MSKLIIKRDGKKEDFDVYKIIKAVNKATNNVLNYDKDEFINIILNDTVDMEQVTVEEIHTLVFNTLNKLDYNQIAENYNSYRKGRDHIRYKKSNIMKTIKSIAVETDRDNANVGNNFSAKLLRIASEANKWAVLSEMPKDKAKLHENGDLHYHDLDSFNLTINCLHNPTARLLKNSFNTGYGTLRTPKRLNSVAALICIIIQSSQNDMFGGQNIGALDNIIAPYIDIERQNIRNEYSKFIKDENELYNYSEGILYESVKQCMEAIIYNLNTMHSRAGSQVPFSSTNIGIPVGTEQEKKDSALACEVFLKMYNRGLGDGEPAIFPNIIFRVKDGINKTKNDPYYNSFKVACEVAAKRMNPTFLNLDSETNLEYYNKGILMELMGCRTAVISNINGEDGCEGRGNIAPVTINIPRISLLANGDLNKFFNILDKRIEQAKDSLLYRYEVLKGLKVNDLPFVAGQKLMKGSEDLNMNDSIEPILKQGTWGIGFIGIAEAVYALTGKHHGEDRESEKLAFEIVNRIRLFTDKYKDEYKLNFACYASPAESLCYRFMKLDKEKFGIIEGVTDKGFYSNSFHIPVNHKISMSDKIKLEAPFHKICNGGHITYVEFDGYPTGKMIERVIEKSFTETDIHYLATNFHIKYCSNCMKYLQEEENVCTCGSTNFQGISRITGYLSLDERFGPGKYNERKNRISHVNGKNVYSSIK